MITRKDIFTEIFKHNTWGSEQSVSGTASNLKYTENLRQVLPKIIKAYKIKSMIDVPCGDMNWFSKLDIKIKYFGYDIVEDIIKQNKEKFKKRRNFHFEVKDAIVDPLPKTDLILCRDLIIHFPLISIYDLMKNIIKSNSKYLLITQHEILNAKETFANKDILFGNFAFRNLTKPPFNFPLPEFLIPEEWSDETCRRYMAFYEISTIKEFLEKEGVY